MHNNPGTWRPHIFRGRTKKNTFLTYARSNAASARRLRHYIRAPLESPHPQLSTGARMSSGHVLHTELEPVEGHPSTRSSVCEPFQGKRRPPAKSATPKTLNPRYLEKWPRGLGCPQICVDGCALRKCHPHLESIPCGASLRPLNHTSMKRRAPWGCADGREKCLGRLGVMAG